MMNEFKIFSGTSNRPLAENIAAELGKKVSECTLKRFSDGEIFFQIDENIRGMDVFIIQSTNPPAEHLMELLIMVDACRRASARRITAVIPYYGYARQDRKDMPRVAITAKLVANLIIKAGVDRVVLMDLHASQIQGFFDCPSDHLYSSKVFNDHIRKLNLQPGVAVSPDVGSVKLVRAFAKELDFSIAIVDKRRPDINKAEVMNIIGEVEGRNIVIRDDVIDTGGTLTEAARYLKERGAKRILAACTHAVLSGKSIEKLMESPIERLIVSDTIYNPSRRLCPKLEVLTVSHVFSEAILRIHEEKSLSSLFE
ncbi:MAG: ribose-phosphate pyrophosphokinase [candidate division Zixibacteria bacterium RBG_16_53_22]|nr:MAG: ribose-phosphate pyrophosphokinase [candidate division Zixibacteria bacterium RBG_16_53_22]